MSLHRPALNIASKFPGGDRATVLSDVLHWSMKPFKFRMPPVYRPGDCISLEDIEKKPVASTIMGDVALE